MVWQDMGCSEAPEVWTMGLLPRRMHIGRQQSSNLCAESLPLFHRFDSPPMTIPSRVKLVEVGPRDGLQNE
jgi:hypothetical protein